MTTKKYRVKRIFLSNTACLDTVWYLLFFNSPACLRAVSHTGRVFVQMLLDYELQTSIKHISIKTANNQLPVPQKLPVCSSLSCLLSVSIAVCSTSTQSSALVLLLLK